MSRSWLLVVAIAFSATRDSADDGLLDITTGEFHARSSAGSMQSLRANDGRVFVRPPQESQGVGVYHIDEVT